MGKKGKVNKLARMSDEERARYLQHRADMEEEARRRKRELIARFIKNKLEKEEAYSRMNTAKINQGWRYILRKIKCKQMALDIKGMMDSFNFLVERKNRQIASLVRAIEDANDQHRRAFQAHTETISYFISIGAESLNKLQAAYEFQKNSLLENWDKEELSIQENQEQAEFKLQLIIYIQNRDFQRYKSEAEMQMATRKNDARLEHEENMRMIWKPKHLQIEYYWSQLREVYNSFLEQHNPIMGHYNSLREKDDFYQRDIARNEMQIQQATEALLSLHKESINMTNIMANKLHRMNSRKEELSRRYWQMKRETKQMRTKTDDRLMVMVNASQDAIERLESLQEKLNKIMQLAEICSKYELPEVTCEEQTENPEMTMVDYENPENLNEYMIRLESLQEKLNKIMQLAEICSKYELPEVTCEEQTENPEMTMVDYENPENLNEYMIEECKEYKKLDKFMLKMNRVKVQTICLRAEKSKLTKENNQLKLYIKKYLTEMALKGGKSRPVSMKVQSEVQKIDASGKVVRRPVTCIEGALSNAVVHERRIKMERQQNRELEVKAYPRIQCWM